MSFDRFISSPDNEKRLMHIDKSGKIESVAVPLELYEQAVICSVKYAYESYGDYRYIIPPDHFVFDDDGKITGAVWSYFDCKPAKYRSFECYFDSDYVEYTYSFDDSNDSGVEKIRYDLNRVRIIAV